MYFNSSIDTWISPKFTCCGKQNAEENELMAYNKVPSATLTDSEDEGLFKY